MVLTAMSFGEMLRLYRRRVHMTLKELGAAVGLSESTLCLIEADKRLPSLKSSEAIVSVLSERVKDPEEMNEMKAALTNAYRLEQVLNSAQESLRIAIIKANPPEEVSLAFFQHPYFLETISALAKVPREKRVEFMDKLYKKTQELFGDEISSGN